MALHLSFEQQPDVRAFLDEQRKTTSTSQALKNRWGIAADYFGNSYAGSGDMANAIFCFRKSLEIMPENVVTMSHLALAYLRSGDSENATVWLKNALKLKPGKAVLHFQLAQTYTQLRQIPQAIQELEEGLKYAPDDPIARNMLQHLRGM
jgi:Tfp pilus assembly protein PilF